MLSGHEHLFARVCHLQFLLKVSDYVLDQDLVEVLLLEEVVLLLAREQGDSHLIVRLSFENRHLGKLAYQEADVLRRLLVPDLLTLDLEDVHGLVQLREVMLFHELSIAHNVRILWHDVIYAPLGRAPCLREKLRHPLL